MNANDKNKFEKLPLFAHKFLAGVPPKSLYRLDRPGERAGMSILDIKEAVGFDTEQIETGIVIRSLFWLRGLIGRIFGWDDADELTKSVFVPSRLAEEEKARSLAEPGTAG